MLLWRHTHPGTHCVHPILQVRPATAFRGRRGPKPWRHQTLRRGDRRCLGRLTELLQCLQQLCCCCLLLLALAFILFALLFRLQQHWCTSLQEFPAGKPPLTLEGAKTAAARQAGDMVSTCASSLLSLDTVRASASFSSVSCTQSASSCLFVLLGNCGCEDISRGLTTACRTASTPGPVPKRQGDDVRLSGAAVEAIFHPR